MLNAMPRPFVPFCKFPLHNSQRLISGSQHLRLAPDVLEVYAPLMSTMTVNENYLCFRSNTGISSRNQPPELQLSTPPIRFQCLRLVLVSSSTPAATEALRCVVAFIFCPMALENQAFDILPGPCKLKGLFVFRNNTSLIMAAYASPAKPNVSDQFQHFPCNAYSAHLATAVLSVYSQLNPGVLV